MRIPAFVGILAIATCSFAQDQVQPYGHFYGPLANGSLKVQPPNPSPGLDMETLRRTFAIQAPRTPLYGAPPQSLTANCSVRLLEVPIPKNVEFTGMQLAPDLNKVAPMPQAKAPAPPCDPSR
jgi:hypothetical protein